MKVICSDWEDLIVEFINLYIKCNIANLNLGNFLLLVSINNFRSSDQIKSTVLVKTYSTSLITWSDTSNALFSGNQLWKRSAECWCENNVQKYSTMNQLRKMHLFNITSGYNYAQLWILNQVIKWK